MKKIIICLFLFSCQEEITPIIEHRSNHVLTISSNIDVEVTVYDSAFSVTVKHFPQETQGTKVTAPKRKLNYLTDCGESGTFESNQLYILCH